MNYRVAKVRTPGKVKMQNENTWGGRWGYGKRTVKKPAE